MSHVVKVVGGLESHQIHIGQQGDRFKTVPKAKQVEAAAVPADQRVHRAGVHGPDRRAAPHPAERRSRSRAHGAGRGADGASCRTSGSIA